MNSQQPSQIPYSQYPMSQAGSKILDRFGEQENNFESLDESKNSLIRKVEEKPEKKMEKSYLSQSQVVERIQNDTVNDESQIIKLTSKN